MIEVVHAFDLTQIAQQVPRSTTIQSGAPSRHPPSLQTKASRRVGRVACPRGLTAAWVWALRQTQGTRRYSDKTIASALGLRAPTNSDLPDIIEAAAQAAW